MLFSRFRRKNNDLMVKKPSEEVLKAHNDAEIIIKENNVDRFLLNMFMDKKGINKFHTTPWFLNLDLKCLLQVNDESKRIRTNAFLTKKEIFFKGKENIKINLEDIIDCKIDGKKVDMICDGVSYKVMFTNKNLAKLFFDYILSHI